jgi:hypothetical protein
MLFFNPKNFAILSLALPSILLGFEKEEIEKRGQNFLFRFVDIII